MTIESNLERIANSLERFVALAEGRVAPAQSTDATVIPADPKPEKKTRKSAAEKPAPEPTPEPEKDDFLSDDSSEEVTVTKEQVIEALTAYGEAAGSTDKARELMAKIGGAKKIGELAKEKYADVFKAANEAAAKLKK